MADAVLWRDGPVAVPLSYTVPQVGELAPLSVRATIDGTGAGAAFYAVVQVLDPNGRVMFNAISSSIAAGGSADVSWFPGGELDSSGGGGLSGTDWGTYVIDTATVPPLGEVGAAWNFDLGSPLLDLTNPLSPTFVAQGVYYVAVWVQSSDGWQTPAPGGGELSFGTPGWTSVQTGGIGRDGGLKNFVTSLTAQASAGDVVGFSFVNYDSVNHAMYSNQALVQRIGTF